jgi:2-polyprenyl-6-methoxyphenol hydroxylase-like FAD-dependent oxidoreductase
MAGPTMALLLKTHLNLDCVIYEIRETHSTIGGAINLTCNGLRIFDKIGIYKALQEHCAETPDFEWVNATGTSIGVLRTGNLTMKKYGYGTKRVLRTFLHEQLERRLAEEEIPVRMGKKLVKVEESADSVTVMFADGCRDTADLLIGADGIHSAVRTSFIEPALEPEYTQLTSLYSIMKTADIKSTPYFHGNFGAISFRHGMVGTGFCDPERSTMYWFNSHEVKEAHDRDGWIAQGKDLDKLKQEVLERTKEINIPYVKEFIETAPDLRFYPIYRLPLGGKWYSERSVLIGDAAHGMLPLAGRATDFVAMSPHVGQGTSMALEDAYLLYRLLEQQSDNLPKAFKTYDEVRRPRIKEIEGYANTGGDLKRETGPWKQWFKEWMIWAWLKIAPESLTSYPFMYDITTVKLPGEV